MPEMLAVERALALVLDAAPTLPAERVALDLAAGRLLREEVRAPEDVPSCDLSRMDGYALQATDLRDPERPLKVIQEIAAGADPGRLVALLPGTAARIMTGAPLPPGADVVVLVEDSEPVPGDPAMVRLRSQARLGDNLARRGADVRRGDRLLEPGDRVEAGEIGVLAACGRVQVDVGRRPRVAVLATGDELVPPGETPGPGRLRNSNGPMLLALARRAGAETRDLGIAADSREALRAALAAGLESDLLLLSGGVSMGVYDLVGESLRALGVEILFERVAIRPGKPFTFGRRGGALVCGCPGNPVSSYVVFQLFVRAALRKMIGYPDPAMRPVRGVLRDAVRQRPGRTAYLQARASWTDGGYRVEVLPTTGSADVVSCARGNSLAIVPADCSGLAAGAEIDLLLLDDHVDR
jgi:molybdopterin molybdotransferase